MVTKKERNLFMSDLATPITTSPIDRSFFEHPLCDLNLLRMIEDGDLNTTILFEHYVKVNGIPKCQTINGPKLPVPQITAIHPSNTLAQEIVLEKQIQEHPDDFATILAEEIKKGNNQVVQFLLLQHPHSINEPCTNSMIIGEALIATREIVKHPIAFAKTLAEEAGKGNAEIVQFLLRHYQLSLYELCTDSMIIGEALLAAAKNGHTEVVRILVQNNYISEDIRLEAINQAGSSPHATKDDIIELLNGIKTQNETTFWTIVVPLRMALDAYSSAPSS